MCLNGHKVVALSMHENVTEVSRSTDFILLTFRFKKAQIITHLIFAKMLAIT